MKRLLIPLFLVACSAGDQGVDVYTNYDERVAGRSTVAAQDVGAAFGTRTNTATGNLSFSVPVLSVPGNNGLETKGDN